MSYTRAPMIDYIYHMTLSGLMLLMNSVISLPDDVI